MMGTSHEFEPNNTIQGWDLKKEVVNKSVANCSNETETKLPSFPQHFTDGFNNSNIFFIEFFLK